MRTWIGDIVKKEGEEAELAGWVHARRDHGKLIFIDLRDRSGIVQVVFGPEITEAPELRLEYVVKIQGVVKKRPPAMVNDKIPTGHFEVEAKELKILNEANPLISVDTDGYEIGEGSRLKYRYIDLRRERMKNNLEIRHRVVKFIRDFLAKKDFWEIETPILTKSTPEGARDYLVPSRLEKGNFYALPQSPQQYKQLLMVGGVERYFQIARCFRDEDTRGDRQPEFTQLDLEMSFVESREEIMALSEELLIEIVRNWYPAKKIQTTPFPRLTYAEATKKYKTDRPDLREDKNDPDLLAFCWIVDFPFFKKGDDGKWTFTHNPFSAPKKEYMNDLLKGENISQILADQYDVVLNGWEIGGGSIRNHKHEALTSVFNILLRRDIQEFTHMFNALDLGGAPPHGGIAWGLDRLIMILQNEPNIREVIAFPKTGEGRDFMMGAPSEVDKKQLDELGLEIKKEK